MTGNAIVAFDWTRAVPLIVSVLALIGIIITVNIQYANQQRQMASAHALKLAEMRQSWINELRNSMAEFQSYAVTPKLDHENVREFYEKGTKIELFLNPKDPNFERLKSCMYAFLEANTTDEKFSANMPYVNVCQDILRAEWIVLKSDLAAAHGVDAISGARDLSRSNT